MMPVALPPNAPKLSEGDRVRVTEVVIGRDFHWTTAIEGAVESYGFEPTESWFAHGKGDRLWLLRLRLRKDDGERMSLILDPRTRVEILTK